MCLAELLRSLPGCPLGGITIVGTSLVVTTVYFVIPYGVVRHYNNQTLVMTNSRTNSNQQQQKGKSQKSAEFLMADFSECGDTDRRIFAFRLTLPPVAGYEREMVSIIWKSTC